MKNNSRQSHLEENAKKKKPINMLSIVLLAVLVAIIFVFIFIIVICIANFIGYEFILFAPKESGTAFNLEDTYNTTNIVAALATCIAVVMTFIIATSQKKLILKQTELAEQQNAFVKEQTIIAKTQADISQKQSKISEQQTNIMEQQNKIALFDKRFDLLMQLLNISGIAGHIPESVIPINKRDFETILSSMLEATVNNFNYKDTDELFLNLAQLPLRTKFIFNTNEPMIMNFLCSFSDILYEINDLKTLNINLKDEKIDYIYEEMQLLLTNKDEFFDLILQLDDQLKL